MRATCTGRGAGRAVRVARTGAGGVLSAVVSGVTTGADGGVTVAAVGGSVGTTGGGATVWVGTCTGGGAAV